MAAPQPRRGNRPAQAARKNRAQQREENRARARALRERKPQRRGISPQIIGGIFTALIVAGILGYAVLRSQASAGSSAQSHEPALTVASDLSGSGANMLSAGSRAPNFTLKDQYGETYKLAAQRGHPVMLEFFAVWCPHCQREAAIIQKLNQKYTSQGVRIWSVLASPYGPNYDNSYGQDTSPATRSDLSWFSKTFGEHVPQLVDPHFATVNRYNISGYPGIYVINKHGVITYANSGDQTLSQLETPINAALKAK